MSSQTPSPTTSGAATSAPTRRESPSSARTGSGRGSRGSRGGRGNRTNGPGTINTTTNNASSFVGHSDEMKGHVFQCFDEQTDRLQFDKTVKALAAYAKHNLRYHTDIGCLFNTPMRVPTIALPVEPATDSGELMRMIFVEEVKEYVKRNTALTANVSAMFSVIWGQCSDNMKAEIKALSGYADAADRDDCFWLLANIQAITLQFDDAKHAVLALVDAHTSFFNCKQQPGQSVDDFADTLIGWADTIESHKGTIGVNLELISAVDDAGMPRTLASRRAIAREQTLATVLVKRADPSKYAVLIDDLANRYSRGNDEYPMTMAAAKKMLVKFKGPRNRSTTTAPPRAGNQSTAAPTTNTPRNDSTGTTHVQNAASATVSNDSAPAAPTATTATAPAATTLTQHAVVLAASDAHQGIDPSWILLDSQSTISVFRNPDMLTDIRPSTHTMRAMTNGGHQDSNMVGNFPNLGQVWYNPNSIANILSLSDVRKVCRVTMDTEVGATLDVHRLDGSIMPFVEHPSGLYVYNPNSNDTISAYTLLSTVADQKRLFSRREIEAADEARALYRKIGRPGEDNFLRLLANNHIQNCPVTPADAKRATIIYGPDIAALKGKTTRSSAAARVPTFIAEVIPPHVLEHPLFAAFP